MPKPDRTPLVLSIDLGTSQLRAMIVDVHGKLHGLGSALWKTVLPPELAPLGSEIDPANLWRQTGVAIRRALRVAGVRGSQIQAVSATSQREGIALVDATGTDLYVGPNTDLRAYKQGRVMDDGHGTEVYATTGHVPSFMFAAAKLQWFSDNRPDVFARIHRVMSLDAWIEMRLTGQIIEETSAAGEIGILDVNNVQPAKDLWATLGLPVAMLPPLCTSGQQIGVITSDAAAPTDLARATPVIAAGPDTQCGLLGMGIHRAGQTGVVAGWSAPVHAVTERAILDPQTRTWTGMHLVPGRWVLESTAGEAGAAYRWAKETLAPGLTDAGVARVAAKAPIGADGALAFLGPHAADMGHVGAQWGGFVFPLLSTVAPVERPQLLRAVLENFAFAIKANLNQINEISGIDPSIFSFGGGMSRNALLMQMLADVTAKPVLVPRTPEVSGLGAAMCAATGLGIFGSLTEASQAMSDKQRTCVPDPVSSLEYEEHFERWSAVGRGLHLMRDML